MKKTAPDLTATFPRSPSETLVGLAHLPRMLDKARADHAGTLGEYLYPCPMDVRLLAFLELDANLFQRAAITRTDAQMAEWVEMHGAPRSSTEKDKFNHMLLALAPETPEDRERFLKDRDAIRPGRDDVTTWAQLIDLDEGRLG